MARLRILAVALTIAAFGGCGGDSPTDAEENGGNGGGTGTGPMRATIAGVAWVAPEANVQSFYIASSNTYGLVGADLTGNVGSRALLINLQGVTGPGTYTLPSVQPFRYANTSSGTNVWETGTGSSGSVVVTVATPTRIAGTFSFTAVPASGNNTGTTVSVTNGAFDVAIRP
jgi:hypothetical protein